MNQNETDKKLDALLAEMPVEPKEDFCDRVLAELSSVSDAVAIWTQVAPPLGSVPCEERSDLRGKGPALRERGECEALDALLAEAPIEPSPDFVEKTMEEIYKPSKVVRIFRFATNVVKFPPQVRRAAGLVAACAVIALAVSPLFWRELCSQPATAGVHGAQIIASRVADTVRNDPELYALWTEDEASSFDDILAVSEIISAADLSTLELLATNDF